MLLGDFFKVIIFFLQDSLHVGVILTKESQLLFMSYIDPTHFHKVFLAGVEKGLVTLLTACLYLQL